MLVQTELDWNSLVLPVHPTREEIADAVYTHGNHDGWQSFRSRLRGLSLPSRHNLLTIWLNNKDRLRFDQRVAAIQVSNYVLALKRGGMWK